MHAFKLKNNSSKRKTRKYSTSIRHVGYHLAMTDIVTSAFKKIFYAVLARIPKRSFPKQLLLRAFSKVYIFYYRFSHLCVGGGRKCFYKRFLTALIDKTSSVTHKKVPVIH